MKPKNFEVQIGKCFVSESKALIRKVYALSENERTLWLWKSYNLRTFESTGDSCMCSSKQLAKWADREATQAEVAQLHDGSAAAITKGEVVRVVVDILRGCSDEQLLAEVRRRGLKL